MKSAARAAGQRTGQIAYHVMQSAQTQALPRLAQVTKTATRTAGKLAIAAIAAAPVFLIDGTKEGYVASVRKQEAALRAAIADAMDGGDYDGHGSYGPIFVRLAWHASGTYDKVSKTGGSNGASMRFAPESQHGANAGLHIARERLEAVKKRFPTVSYADIWTLAGVVAIEEMGGPKIPWRPGRSEYSPAAFVTPPDGRLPDAAQRQAHVRDIFYRMGFNDQEITALIGAHALGKCHTKASGYDGPWTRSPTTFSNTFYTALLEEKWTYRNWKGPKQYENERKDLMMLPADMAFLEDPAFKKYVEIYAKDETKFFNDFSKAFSKLLELGVPFPPEKAAPAAPEAAAAPAAPAKQQGFADWIKSFMK